jgi:hypothetical protein
MCSAYTKREGIPQAGLPTFLFYVNSRGNRSGTVAARLKQLAKLSPNANIAVQLSVEIQGYCGKRLVLNQGRWICASSQPTAGFFEQSTLESFLQWALTNYDHSPCSLIFSSHGLASRRIQRIYSDIYLRLRSAWTEPVLVTERHFTIVPALYEEDQNTSSSLYLGQIANAIGSVLKKNTQFQVIAFDACGMGTVETLDALSPYAEVIVGSGTLTIDFSWADWLTKLTLGATAKVVATALVDTYEAQEQDHTASIVIEPSLSAFDSAASPKLSGAVNKFGSQLNTLLSTNAAYCHFRKTLNDYATVPAAGLFTRDVHDLGKIGRMLFPNDPKLPALSIKMEQAAHNCVISGFSPPTFSACPRIFLFSGFRNNAPQDYLDSDLVPFSGGAWGRLQRDFMNKLDDC